MEQNKELIKITIKDKAKMIKQIMIKKEIARREAFDSFEKFLLYVNNKFWSIRLQIKEFKELVDALDKASNGFIDIIVAQLPAGFGKSYLRESWNAWMIGKDKQNTVLVGTYSDMIAKSFTSYFKNISSTERYEEIFGSNNYETKTQNEIRLKGTILPYTHFTRGAGASTTGTRAKFIQIDDIIKDYEEASSELIIQKRWDWYGTTLKTRKAGNKLFEMWMGTRWKKTDPMGKKLEEIDNQISAGLLKPYKVKIISIPAMVMDKKGNEVSICEDWTTTEELKKIKLELSDRPEIWESLYQQNPIDSIGALFPESKMKHFDTHELLNIEAGQYMENGINMKDPDKFNVFTICDVADTGDDYHSVAIIAYNKVDKSFNLIDVIHTQSTVDITSRQHAQKIIKYKSVLNRIEKNNIGKFYAKEVKELVKGKAASPFRLVTTKMNKEQKIYVWAAFILEIIKFRSDWKTLPDASEYKQFIKQLISYDKSGKNKHDDAPDVLAMAAQTISKEFNIINSTLQILDKHSHSKNKEIER